MDTQDRKNIFILILICVLLYFIGITSINLTDPDEVFYSETAKEMLAQKSLLTPLIFEKPQFEKPPFFYWLLMTSFKAFGVNTFAARLIPSLCGLIGVLGTYYFMRKIANSTVSLYAGLILASSFLYFGLSKTVLTDITFSVLTAFSLYAFYLWHKYRRRPYLALFMVFLSLSALTKGPLALAICLVTIILFLICVKDLKSLFPFLFNRYWLIFLVLGCGWFIHAFLRYGKEFWWEFFIHDNWHRVLYSEHRNFDKWFFYPAIILAGMLPWTSYLLMFGRGFKKYKNEQVFFFCWIFSVFFILMPAHSKLISYILPLFPALCCSLSFSLEGKPKRMVAAGCLNIVVGIGLLFALPFVKREYAELARSAFLCFGALSASIISGGIYLVLGRVRASIFANITGLILFVSIGSFLAIPAKIETAFCDYGLDKIVIEYKYQGKPILSSKLYARGVYFYTHNPVVVIDNNKQPFWSPHPVEVICNDGEISAFFGGKEGVLCVIQHDDLETLDRIFSGKRENKVLLKNFDRIVVWSALR